MGRGAAENRRSPVLHPPPSRKNLKTMLTALEWPSGAEPPRGMLPPPEPKEGEGEGPCVLAAGVK